MSEKKEKKSGDSFMMKLVSFIMDKRSLVFLVTIIAIVFSAFSRNWVEVENDLAAFLPDHSETRQGLDVMEEQFTTFGTAQFMVANITLDDAWDLADGIKALEGVQSVTFGDSKDYYNNASALYTVTFSCDEDDDRCLDALARVEDYLAGYDTYLSTDLGNTQAENIDAEVQVIMVLVAMLFMQFKIGPDVAICLIKAILYALMSVFVVMPGLMMLFGPLMDRTEHKSFVPKILFVGRFAYITRYIIPPIFVAVVFLAFNVFGDCPYAYGYGGIDTPKHNDTQIAQQMIEDTDVVDMAGLRLSDPAPAAVDPAAGQSGKAEENRKAQRRGGCRHSCRGPRGRWRQ